MPERPSPAVVAAVRGSLQAVVHRPVELAEVFYTALFEMEPSLRVMFATDMTEQMVKMTEALLGAISALDQPDLTEIESALATLGAVHRTRYGIENAAYGYVGHALTRAVREVAGPAYSGTISSSWIAVVQWVAAHMMAGADAAASITVAIPEQTPRAAGAFPQPRSPQDGSLTQSRNLR